MESHVNFDNRLVALTDKLYKYIIVVVVIRVMLEFI